MKRAVAALCAVVGLSVALTACGGSGPSESACKAAMKADYATAIANPAASAATEPSACKGLPTATLQKLAGEVMDESLGS